MKLLRAALLGLVALCAAEPVCAQTVQAVTVNGSIVIATGNTFQTALAAVVSPAIRRSLTIQNNNLTDNCWIFIGATVSATKGTSIFLTPGGSYTRYYPYLPSDNIAATCATTSSTLYVDTQ